MNLLYEQNSIEQNYPTITRSKLLTAPIIILGILHYEYGGEIQERKLFKHVNRSYSQLSQNIRKLENRDFILCKKNGRQVKIRITSSGVKFIENYVKNVIQIFISFLDFLKSKLTQTDKTAEIELIDIVLREFLNDSDVFTIVDRLNEKYRKLRKNQHQKEYFNAIYDECEKGTEKDTLVHQVFAFLHQNYAVSKRALYLQFPNANRSTLSTLYRKWGNITYEKYIIPNQ